MPMPNRNCFLLFLLCAVLSGCAPGCLGAHIHMVRAEGAYDKAHEMRKSGVPYTERLTLYRVACEEAVKAYNASPSVFTLSRIEIAADACFRVEDLENREMFLEFEARYSAEHPDEVRYGDAFPTLEG